MDEGSDTEFVDKESPSIPSKPRAKPVSVANKKHHHQNDDNDYADDAIIGGQTPSGTSKRKPPQKGQKFLSS